MIEVLHLFAINQLESFTYDMRLKMLKPNKFDERIVIIEIDEKSLHEPWRWPWGCNNLEDLVSKLFDDYHLKILGFDIVLTEKNECSGFKSFNKSKLNFSQMNKNNGIYFIVSELTEAQVPEFVYRELDGGRVKGKERPGGIFESFCEETLKG